MREGDGTLMGNVVAAVLWLWLLVRAAREAPGEAAIVVGVTIALCVVYRLVMSPGR